MSDQRDSLIRLRTLQVIVLLIVGVILGRLFYIQLIDDRYKDMADNNALRHVVQYPPRGEVRDRNGEFIVQSREEAAADIEAMKIAARDKMREAVKHIEWELTDI